MPMAIFSSTWSWRVTVDKLDIVWAVPQVLTSMHSCMMPSAYTKARIVSSGWDFLSVWLVFFLNLIFINILFYNVLVYTVWACCCQLFFFHRTTTWSFQLFCQRCSDSVSAVVGWILYFSTTCVEQYRWQIVVQIQMPLSSFSHTTNKPILISSTHFLPSKLNFESITYIADTDNETNQL